MKTTLSSRRQHYVARVSSFLIMLVFIAGVVGCAGGGVEYDLTITSTGGGSVTTPGEGPFTYDEGEIVDLVADAEEGYLFINWTGDVGTIADVNDATTTITMNGDYSIAAEFAKSAENIWLSGLMTDLQNDATDANEYIVDVYEDEHFARDLEDNLEGLGYDVTFLTVLEFDGTLLWVPLLKIRYSEDYAVIVNPRTDDIVTAEYDGDGDGATETLVGMNLTGVSSWLENLVATALGNDGQYLIFEFDSYETVRLVDTAVGQLTYEDLMMDLWVNGVSEREYVKDTYDCDDFARDLEDDLEEWGYRVTIKIIWWHEGEKKVGHVVVNVHFPGHVVTIEPQTDEDVTNTYDGDGDGTVESSRPGGIRSQVWLWGFCHGVPLCGGTDDDYLIFEYEDFDDIPFPVD